MRHILLAALLCFGGVTVSAQSQFSPAIIVNDDVITAYELDQRRRFLELVRAPGNPADLAREQLIEEKLQLQETRRVGIELPPDAVEQGMADFAGRANLTLDQFTQLLNSAGVEIGTLRDFTTAGLAWREYIRGRFRNEAQVDDDEIEDAAAGSTGGRASIRVLVSEIIIAAPPPRAAAAQREAERISELTSVEAFSAAARRVSALPSRANGGRLPWQPLTDLPPVVQNIVLGLNRGEVSDPIPIQNGVALFQLRDIEEVAPPAPQFGAIDFAVVGVASAEDAARISARADTCDDLYGIFRNASEEQLYRDTLPPDQIPTEVALVLPRLDPGEVTLLPAANGSRLVMLCGRTPVLEDGEEIDREAIRNQLVSRRLGGFAEALLAELRADATIVER
ncbi:peptidylprolyl isomerase [Aestuariibius sp. 2305UL40-4]|uniref:peptidylprolyl isomerase n=1 Tax=Aestuariibius violaceus TaxID=3234132 RepID=UPI00345E3391